MLHRKSGHIEGESVTLYSSSLSIVYSRSESNLSWELMPDGPFR